jgi:carboxybiotin decarboxylase
MDNATGEFLGFLSLSWQAVVMLVIGGVLIWLGIARKVEPVLLVPIGFGCLLANIPMHAAGANVAGQIASVVAGGVMLMLVPMFL